MKKIIYTILTTVVIIVFIFLIYIMMGYRLKDCFKYRGLELCFSRPEPSLSISDVKFLYYDLDGKLINESNTNPVKIEEVTNPLVNLREVRNIVIYALIENKGNVDLLVSYKNTAIETSQGQIMPDGRQNIPIDNFPITRGKKKVYKIIELNFFDIEKLINIFKEDINFHFIFKPEVEYYIKGKSNKRISLDIVIKCGDEFGSSRLPLFRINCLPDVILN